MDAVVVRGLKKTYGKGKKKVTAVKGISFSVKKGEIFGLLGANGAGKTTTLNMLSGLLEKDKGTIRILGKIPEEDWEFVKNRMNTSTAYYPLSDVLTVRENLRVYAKIYNINNVEEKIDELLNTFELTHLGNKKVSNLSSGERTRTALCKGLINDPEILLLDECTVGLDPDIAEKTRSVIKKFNAENNCTIIFTSHYMYEVEELCDRIAFMEKGKIVMVDTADKLKKEIKNQTIEITVKKDLKGLKQMLEKEKVDVIFAKGNTLIFEVSSKKDKAYKVLNKIFRKGYLLNDLHIKKPTLDDIFIKLARKK